MNLPHVRKEGLVIRELRDEVLVYDRYRDKAHCLNKTAALVWKHCDGLSSVSQIANSVSLQLNTVMDERLVWFVLDQLSKDHLLEETVQMPEVMSGMDGTRGRLVLRIRLLH